MLSNVYRSFVNFFNSLSFFKDDEETIILSSNSNSLATSFQRQEESSWFWSFFSTKEQNDSNPENETHSPLSPFLDSDLNKRD